MSDSVTSTTSAAGPVKPPQSFLGRYYTYLVLTAIVSVMVFMLLMGVLEVFNLFDGGTRNYSVSGSPFHITSHWPWSVKAGFWLMGSLMVEMKVLIAAAVVGPFINIARKSFSWSSGSD